MIQKKTSDNTLPIDGTMRCILSSIFKLTDENREDCLKILPDLARQGIRCMAMKERDSGSTMISRKYMSLKARFYLKENKKKGEEQKEEGITLIKRDSVVTVQRTAEDGDILYYRVLTIFKLYHNKWLPILPEDKVLFQKKIQILITVAQ